MKINGEGIYGTGPWKVFGEGEVNNVAGSFMDNDEKEFTSKDYRFTCKDGYLYAFCMKPSCAEFCIRSLKDQSVESVEVLGEFTVESFSNNEYGLKITTDKATLADKPLCFKIKLK
jgi:alpha-L-fucosidase